MITREDFFRKMDYEPKDDDLERVNCPSAGMVGHRFCGWCHDHEVPRYQCGCIATQQTKAP